MSRNPMNAAARRSFGFTLVELLVVIGIIALLISILLPALNRARASATSIACQANLRSIGQAIALYVNNSKGMLPYGYATAKGSNGSDTYSNYALLLLNALDSKMPTNAYDATQSGPGISNPNTSKLRSTFFCPDVQGAGMNAQSIGVVHYLTHPRLLPDLTQVEPSSPEAQAVLGSNAGKNRVGYKITKLKRSAEVAMLFDGSLTQRSGDSEIFAPEFEDPVANVLDYWAVGYGDFMFFLGNFYPGQPINLTPNNGAQYFNQDSPNNRHNVRFRHMKNKTANVLFADGHTGSYSLKSNTSDPTNATDFPRSAVYVTRP